MSRLGRSWTGAVLATAAVGSVTAAMGPSAAQAAQNETTPGYEVIASGLNNPRGIAVLRDGTVLIAESGTGKPGCAAGTECVGATGSVYRVGGGRSSGRVVTGLQSVGVGPKSPQEPVSATGPNDVAPGPRGGFVVLNGGGGNLEHRATLGEDGKYAGTLYQSRSGRVLGDLVKYETEADPDWVLGHAPTPQEPTTAHSNAWRFAQTRTGWLVTDAGGNDLVKVPGWGRPSTETIFPDSKSADGKPVQAVPSGVVVAGDGTIYVCDMGALKPGASRIWKIVPGHKPQVLVNGLTALSDLALDSKGNLVALSLTGGYTQTGPLPGKVHKIDTLSKEVTEVPTGDKLSMSTGLGIGPHDEIYVTNKSVGTSGELVRITQ
ncbi:ScyD/ScyE family protein [Streptomyces sp.]|uniref:ScyD/ScyE family protein n=1 Tax=Streptomyces sp. TaxID=1931 RepID=UPI002D76A45A|nr:ScyD/ScyE family protein [Streptomyces sp.]HET6358295.1 ScyD/ScyE family protein [Streptomyces sp.]